MVRLSVLSFSSLLLGTLMFGTGLACYLKDLSLYEKDEAHNAILRVFIGSVVIVFVPIVYAVEQCLEFSIVRVEPEGGATRKRPGACIRQQSQNAPPPRLRRRHC
ncbi:uncharacterized protein LOC113491939 [Trichoplusia ni]|uniref:Uncharacterized protein LOC113491939 n=1 Tax=Trichoplusia ni TaxID=7111 RepID=A0A7E5V9J4_TRINI|nr:uncharacterized protein LOC113491939 [Trichoplusia ni]